MCHLIGPATRGPIRNVVVVIDFPTLKVRSRHWHAPTSSPSPALSFALASKSSPLALFSQLVNILVQKDTLAFGLPVVVVTAVHKLIFVLLWAIHIGSIEPIYTKLRIALSEYQDLSQLLSDFAVNLFPHRKASSKLLRTVTKEAHLDTQMDPPSEPSTSSTPRIYDAQAPYNHDDADLILRSCDNVDFRVHRVMISRASSVFKELLSLPQGVYSTGIQANIPDDTRDGLSIVRIPEETEHSLTLLLGLCYPGYHSDFRNVSDVKAALRIADKFQVHSVWKVEPPLWRAMEHEPETVFLLACRCSMPDLSRAAAKLTLRQIKSVLDVAVSDADAAAYLRLMRYHAECVRAAVQVTTNFDWINGSRIPCAIGETQKSGSCICPRITQWTAGYFNRSSVVSYSIPKWMMGYMERCRAALEKSPQGSTVQHWNRLLPSLAKASECASCREKVFEHIEEFGDLFASMVDKRVAAVSVL